MTAERNDLRVLLSLLLGAGVVAHASAAGAQLFEPDGTQIPLPLSQDIGDNEVAAFPNNSEETLSLAALFASRGEDIDWQADAATQPAAFSPLCGFTGYMVLRGGGCGVDFGWYNVDLTSDAAPLDSEIYPLVTKEQLAAYEPFEPYIGEPPIVGETLEDIRTDPRYAGGLIGLAVVGNDAWCNQTKFSEHRLNTMCTICEPPAPWITAVVWQSTATPNAFYIGFEDLPMQPDELTGDGDFNDFVYFVEGITCAGAGVPCLTAAEGACSFGLTECQSDGTLICLQQLQPGAEVCDNIDNDCNGLVDEGDLCPVGEICHRGLCKPNCSGGEFPCESPLVCDPIVGYCVEPECAGVVCEEAGQVCIGGECLGGCANVTCPIGQVCQLGRCVDPCVARQPDGENPCMPGMVCEGGACLEPCGCRPCKPDTECDMGSGKCVSTGCIDVACPVGEVCRNGECGDTCVGVVCPGGAACIDGQCGEPIPGQMAGTGGAAGAGAAPTLINVPTNGSGASGADDGAGDEPGCGCRAVGGRSPAVLTSALLLLLVGFGGRRRSRRNLKENQHV